MSTLQKMLDDRRKQHDAEKNKTKEQPKQEPKKEQPKQDKKSK